MSIKKGVIDMNLAIRYDDTVHRKLKIIAAFQDISLNKLIMKVFDKTIVDWEREHGEIKIPEE